MSNHGCFGSSESRLTVFVGGGGFTGKQGGGKLKEPPQIVLRNGKLPHNMLGLKQIGLPIGENGSVSIKAVS